MQIFYIKYYCLIADTNFVKQRIMRLELARSIGAIGVLNLFFRVYEMSTKSVEKFLEAENAFQIGIRNCLFQLSTAN